MESTNAQRPYRKNYKFQLNTCTLCPFMTHVKGTFEQHLMKSHGVKLMGLEALNETGDSANLGRVGSDYGIREKFEPKGVLQHQCPTCQQKYKSLQTFRFHKDACKKQAEARKANNFPMYPCNNCDYIFDNEKKLNRHKRECGVEKDICCQICPYKCLGMKKIKQHLIVKHNLVCRPVDEADFEQALNGTPYTLERTVEHESLPHVKELAYLVERDLLPPKQSKLGVLNPSQHLSKPKIGLFTCQICKGEFIKERFLNKHLKYDDCAQDLLK